MNEIKLTIGGMDQFFERAQDMAKRLDAGDRSPQPAQIMFEHPGALFSLLTPNRWSLLACLRKLGPSSIRALSKTLQRDYRGVHADVTALREAGLIEKDDKSRVLVPWSKITAEMNFEAAA
jgi:predicted transcriptional regulator